MYNGRNRKMRKNEWIVKLKTLILEEISNHFHNKKCQMDKIIKFVEKLKK